MICFGIQNDGGEALGDELDRDQRMWLREFTVFKPSCLCRLVQIIMNVGLAEHEFSHTLPEASFNIIASHKMDCL